ncbi:membrane or secreted protein [Aequorivita sp. F47161]|uniref:Membrane or secreted protein n=1 Tax=Aequorivita vitellina TaxID=2874475 RepID=A0A9X1U321_9FLAO|nr:membrane or secreted protein [Aequorivita vitellina]MCG2418832.1 membrane or secreted protein [Aequorivita vitellina]
MYKVITYIIFCLIVFPVKAQDLVGAWESVITSETGEQLKTVLIVSESHNAFTTYNNKTGAFVSTRGGSWKLDGQTLIEKVEFNTDNPETVGLEKRTQVFINDSVLNIEGNVLKMNRIDNGTPGKLQGAWLMSGRTKDGVTQVRDITLPRKTMKILSGTRFQWIAYNTETKQFMATGGGTYTTKNGEYTETIEFFSKDIEKVGLQLNFNFNLKDGNWHHTGFSTKGDPIDEVWSKRN